MLRDLSMDLTQKVLSAKVKEQEKYAMATQQTGVKQPTASVEKVMHPPFFLNFLFF